MDGRATHPEAERDAADVGQALPAAGQDGSRGGEGGSPFLRLDGFAGPLDHLLTLARAQQIDLSAISLTALVDQLVVALREAPGKIPLGQKGDWVVMAAWLVQLRARLLLPADAPAQQEAAAEADQFRGRLVALEEIQALAGWLERRPQLGHDVFTRGQPEIFGNSVEAGQAIDVVGHRVKLRRGDMDGFEISPLGSAHFSTGERAICPTPQHHRPLLGQFQPGNERARPSRPKPQFRACPTLRDVDWVRQKPLEGSAIWRRGEKA
jgi:hypothetical protein